MPPTIATWPSFQSSIQYIDFSSILIIINCYDNSFVILQSTLNLISILPKCFHETIHCPKWQSDDFLPSEGIWVPPPTPRQGSISPGFPIWTIRIYTGNTISLPQKNKLNSLSNIQSMHTGFNDLQERCMGLQWCQVSWWALVKQDLLAARLLYNLLSPLLHSLSNHPFLKRTSVTVFNSVFWAFASIAFLFC